MQFQWLIRDNLGKLEAVFELTVIKPGADCMNNIRVVFASNLNCLNLQGRKNENKGKLQICNADSDVAAQTRYGQWLNRRQLSARL